MCQQHTFCKKNWCFNVSPKLGFKHLTILTVGPLLQVTTTIQPVGEVHTTIDPVTSEGAIVQAGLFRPKLAVHVQGPSWMLMVPGKVDGIHVAGECWHSKLVTRNQWSKHLIIQMPKVDHRPLITNHKTAQNFGRIIQFHPKSSSHPAYNWYPLHIGYSPFSKSLLPQALLKCWVLNNQEDQRSPQVALPFCPAHPCSKRKENIEDRDTVMLRTGSFDGWEIVYIYIL